MKEKTVHIPQPYANVIFAGVVTFAILGVASLFKK